MAASGISDHAQAELTDIVYVDLPKVGTKLTAGQTVAVVESVKAASDIYCPVGRGGVGGQRGVDGQPGVGQHRSRTAGAGCSS